MVKREQQTVSNVSVTQGIKISLMLDLVLLKYLTPRMTFPTARFHCLYFSPTTLNLLTGQRRSKVK